MTLRHLQSALTPREAGQERRRSGAQSVERALQLLTEMGTCGLDGFRLVDLARRSGIDLATAHRHIRALCRYGFVEQDALSRRYFPGIQFFSIAAAASNRSGFGTAVRTRLIELQKATEGTALFLVRSNDDAVCVDAAIGCPHHTPAIIGMRWPLCADAGGIALLSGLPQEDGEETLLRSMRSLDIDAESVASDIGRALRQVLTEGYVCFRWPGTLDTSIAAPVCGSVPGNEGALVLRGAATPDISRGSGILVEAVLDHAAMLSQDLTLPPSTVVDMADWRKNSERTFTL